MIPHLLHILQSVVSWIHQPFLLLYTVNPEISDLEKPGIKKLISRIKGEISNSISEKELLDKCSETIGCDLSNSTKGFLLDSIENSPNNNQKLDEQIGQVLGFIAATKEYQLV